MNLIPKFLNKGKLPTLSKEESDRRINGGNTAKSDTTSRVSSGKTSSEAKDRESRGSVSRYEKSSQASQINSFDAPWVVESKQREAAEEEAYQKEMNLPYYATAKKPTKLEWRQLKAAEIRNLGTIRASRKVSAPVRAINNYIGEAKHRANDGTILLKGKYTLPAIAMASLTPAMVSAPVTTAATMGGGYVGEKAFNGVSKLLTGKDWTESVSNLTGLAPEAASLTNPGLWLGGGLPFWSNTAGKITSVGDQVLKSTASDAINYGFKEAGERALETYFPAIEDWTFTLPYKTQERIFPLRLRINYGHIYPRENARLSEALNLAKNDPALQGKGRFGVMLRDVGGFNSKIGIGAIEEDGGLRSIRAVINPGVEEITDPISGQVLRRPINKSAIKRRLLVEWNRRRQPGDILTGDAFGLQDPINTIDNLNLNTGVHLYDYGLARGLSSDSYALIHGLAKRGDGRIVYGRTPMERFNPLAEDGKIYGLLTDYELGKITPIHYAVEAENYFRNNGVKIRQPYSVGGQILFPHPSYVEGLGKYMK